MVRESDFKSEDRGFDPLAKQGEEQFFCPSESNLVQTRLCLTPTPTHLECTARIRMCAHVKDPISIWRKRLGLTAGGIKTRKHFTGENNAG